MKLLRELDSVPFSCCSWLHAVLGWQNKQSNVATFVYHSFISMRDPWAPEQRWFCCFRMSTICLNLWCHKLIHLYYYYTHTGHCNIYLSRYLFNNAIVSSGASAWTQCPTPRIVVSAYITLSRPDTFVLRIRRIWLKSSLSITTAIVWEGLRQFQVWQRRPREPETKQQQQQHRRRDAFAASRCAYGRVPLR